MKKYDEYGCCECGVSLKEEAGETAYMLMKWSLNKNLKVVSDPKSVRVFCVDCFEKMAPKEYITK